MASSRHGPLLRRFGRGQQAPCHRAGRDAWRRSAWRSRPGPVAVTGPGRVHCRAAERDNRLALKESLHGGCNRPERATGRPKIERRQSRLIGGRRSISLSVPAFAAAPAAAAADAAAAAAAAVRADGVLWEQMNGERPERVIGSIPGSRDGKSGHHRHS